MAVRQRTVGGAAEALIFVGARGAAAAGATVTWLLGRSDLGEDLDGGLLGERHDWPRVDLAQRGR